MEILFTSDQHYDHKNICRFAGRPYSGVKEMNEALIKNHNEMVNHNDTVYFLGDFAFCSLNYMESILYRLNGKKHLILGNHDKKINKNRKYFLENNLFESIDYYKEITIDKQLIILFHYGMRVWNKHHYGSWLLYGHSHGSLPPHGKSVDVGVDDKNISEEYRPYTFEEVKQFMDKRDTKNSDRHK